MSGSALSRLLGQISKPQESLQIDSTSGVLDVAFPSLPSASYITVGYWQKNKSTAASSPYGRSNKVTLHVETPTGGALWIVGNASVDLPSTVLYNDNAMVSEDTSTVSGEFVGDLAFYNAGGNTVAEIEGWVYHVHRYAYNSTDDLIQYGSWGRIQTDNYVRFAAFDEWTPQQLRDFASGISDPHPDSSKNPSGITAGEAATMTFDSTITAVKPFYWDFVSTPAQTEDYINYYKNLSVFVSSSPPTKGEILAWSMATKDAPPSGAWGFYPLVSDGVITWNDFSGNGRHLINSSTMAMAVANIEPSPVSVDTTAATIDTLATPTPNSTGCTTTVNIPEASGTLHVYVTTTGSQPAWAIAYYGTHQTVTASGSNAIIVTGKASSITYSMDVVYEDIYGNYSNVLSTTFTTTAPATSGTWKITDNSTGGDYTGILGTYILEYSGGDDTTNFAGSPNRFEVQNWEVGGRATLLTKITGIASLPAGKNITGSRLLLWVDDVSNDPYIDLFRSLQDWIYDEATWINKKTGSFPWNASGSLGSGSDIASTPLVTFQVVTGAIGGYITISSSALTALALGWYNGSITNNGLTAICNNNAQDAGYSLYVNFINSLQTDGHRPIFELDWENSGSTTHDVTITESLTATTTQASQVNFSGSINESASASDSQSASIVSSQSITETVSASESESASNSTNSSITESLTATSTQDGIAINLSSVTETITASETSTNGLVANASITESNSASDTNSSAKVTSSSIAESLTASESISGIVLNLASQFESISASESSSNTLTANAVITESAAATDSLISQVIFNAFIQEINNAGESSNRQLNIDAVISESANASELVSVEIINIVFHEESASAAEIASNYSNSNALVIESANATETALAQAILNALINESVEAIEVSNGQLFITLNVRKSILTLNKEHRIYTLPADSRIYKDDNYVSID